MLHLLFAAAALPATSLLAPDVSHGFLLWFWCKTSTHLLFHLLCSCRAQQYRKLLIQLWALRFVFTRTFISTASSLTMSLSLRLVGFAAMLCKLQSPCYATNMHAQYRRSNSYGSLGCNWRINSWAYQAKPCWSWLDPNNQEALAYPNKPIAVAIPKQECCMCVSVLSLPYVPAVSLQPQAICCNHLLLICTDV